MRNNITALDLFLARLKSIAERTADLGIRRWIIALLYKTGAKGLARILVAFSLKSGRMRRVNGRRSNSFWLDEDFQKVIIDLMHWPMRISKGMLNVRYKGRELHFKYDSNVQLANTRYLLARIFVEGKYADLDVKGRQVVDIGANVGDSAIYFALNGARHVYAYEPFPYSYYLALANVRLNRLDSRISLFNEGCGRKASLYIPVGEKNYLGSDLRGWKKGKLVKIRTLKQIVEQNKISNGVLKMNCEGCEYQIIMNCTGDVLRKFSTIRISYHYGYINIVEKLKESGFDVFYTAPRYFMSEEKKNRGMYSGRITAIRKD